MSIRKVQHPACSVIPLHMQRHLAEHGNDDVRERIASRGRPSASLARRG